MPTSKPSSAGRLLGRVSKASSSPDFALKESDMVVDHMKKLCRNSGAVTTYLQQIRHLVLRLLSAAGHLGHSINCWHIYFNEIDCKKLMMLSFGHIIAVVSSQLFSAIRCLVPTRGNATIKYHMCQ